MSTNSIPTVRQVAPLSAMKRLKFFVAGREARCLSACVDRPLQRLDRLQNPVTAGEVGSRR